MERMVSSAAPIRSRKRPEERREEILSAAASIAVEQGLEKVTLRAVAERLGVRPGLITHYFPAAEDLVVSAFVRAATIERERFFPPSHGDALARLAHFVGYIESGVSLPLARLWLNARHLSRFSPSLDAALREQDRLDRAQLIALLADGMAASLWPEMDTEAACTRIFLAVDGRGSYVNTTGDFDEDPAFAHFVSEVAEWTLRLEPGTLVRASDGAR